MTGLYEEVLGNLAGGQTMPSPKPPRASASVVPWRTVGGLLEVFWVRRARSMRFMGGWHAFPGGGLSRADCEALVDGLPDSRELGPQDGAMPRGVTDEVELGELLPSGLVACALRELYEETGILLASPTPDAAMTSSSRGPLEQGVTSLVEVLDRLGVRLTAQRLVYAGRWLTPPLGPVRFDNRFFLMEWTPNLPRPSVASGELDLGEWIPPGEALARWQAGEVMAAPPIVHILRVLAEDGPVDGLDRLRSPFEANLGEYRRVDFRPGVMLFPQPTATLPPATHTNAYLLGRGEAVLVDPGSPFEQEVDRLAGALAEAERRLDYSVKAIWLTHHHPDHVGGVAALQRRLALPVRAHAETVKRLDGAGIEFAEPLDDGMRIELGGRLPDGSEDMTLEVLHTPGHARGHLCFYEPFQRWLIGGDMVAGFGTIVIDPPEGDMEQYLTSLERLEGLDAGTLFPGHGPTILDPSGKFAEYRRHRLWREERILAAWQAGSRTPEAMLPIVYEDVPPIAHPLALRQIVAHLERLERQGRLPQAG